MKRTSMLLILGIVVLLLAGGYTGLLFWQKSSSEAELKKVENNLMAYENEILKYENQEVLEAINAKKALGVINLEKVEWSKVIKKVRATVPQRGGEELVEILSYSGSSGNKISMNIKTNPESGEAYFDVADLIEDFDESDFFTEVFVPSISSGLDDEGREILTFQMSTVYKEEDISELLEESESEPEPEPEAEPEPEVEVETEELEETIGEILDESLEEAPSEEAPSEEEPVLR